MKLQDEAGFSSYIIFANKNFWILHTRQCDKVEQAVKLVTKLGDSCCDLEISENTIDLLYKLWTVQTTI